MRDAEFTAPGEPPFATSQPWQPLLIRRETIEQYVEELADRQVDAASPLRRLDICHPESRDPGRGLAPGIRVSLDVLRPGEEIALAPSNASEVNFCIRGEGEALFRDSEVSFGRYDVWTRPALTRARHRNTGHDMQVRLTYSNAPVLEKLHAHIYPSEEEYPDEGPAGTVFDEGHARPHPFGDLLSLPHPGGGDDVQLMSYEKLIDPDVVAQVPLHWPWDVVQTELDKLAALGSTYRGRRLYLLYNPATGRTNGTTNSFFATITIRPPRIVDRPHRHASAAINYFFGGRGDSVVGGKRYEWKAGDLMFTAPGWMVHRHASHDEPVYELTIQDSPYHIALDSLLWQENLKHPLRLLGSQLGFQTNIRARS